MCARVCVYVVVRHLSNDQITTRNDLINNNEIDIAVFFEWTKYVCAHQRMWPRTLDN